MKVKTSLYIILLVVFNTILFSQVPGWEWAISADGYSWDQANAIAVDEYGNLYITGTFRSNVTFGSYTITRTGDRDIFVAKMDPNGNWLWADNAGGSEMDIGNSISVDNAGNSYITGFFNETATFGDHSVTSNGSSDIFVAEMDTNGNWLWANSALGNSLDTAEGIVIDSSGNSYITGYFNGTITFGSYTFTSYGEEDTYIAKIDSGGNWLSASRAGGSNSDIGIKLKLDNYGNTYVVGRFQGTATFGTFSIASAGINDIFVAKLNPNGNWLWATQAGGSGWDSGSDIYTDSDGNCYISGYFQNIATFGDHSITSNDSYDIFVAKMYANGNWLWATQAGGSGWDMGLCISLDNLGNSYVSGYFEITANFGQYSLTSFGGSDIFLAKLDSIGNWIWVLQASGAANEYGYSLITDNEGCNYLTGKFQGIVNFGSNSISCPDHTDIFVAKRGNVEFTSDFIGNPTSGNQPLEVQFTDLSNGSPINWEWDFDNDSTIDSYEQNPTNIYSEAGIYTVSLTVSDGTNTDTEIKEDYISITNVDAENETITSETIRLSNHPNPFNPSTKIEFSIQNNSMIELSIFNIKEQKIKTLAHNEFTKGSHSITWDGDDAFNKPVSSGVYLYKLNVNGKTEAVKKCLLLK
jgi:PKD repeat protein